MAKKSTRLEALHNIFEENGISPDTIELNYSSRKFSNYRIIYPIE